MIEVLSKNDVSNISNEKSRDFLISCFDRLPKEFFYPKDGYFILVEDFNELLFESIKIGNVVLPSFENGLYEYISMVEVENDYMEILLLLDNDFGVSLILLKNTIPNTHNEELKKFII